MDSSWGEEGSGQDRLSGVVKAFAEKEEGKKPAPAPRISSPPLNATAEERRLHSVFKYLRGTDDYIKKAEFAADVLNGEYGAKNEILARLMMGPNEFREVLEDTRDIVPPLLELLLHKEIDIRVKVAKVLAERGDGRVLFDMYCHLEENEYWARHEFSTALWKIARRLDDVEAVAEIRTQMMYRAEMLGGIAPALLVVKMHLNRLRGASNDDKKSVPPTLREPPMAVIRDAVGRPDTTLQIAGRNERPDATMRINTGKVGSGRPAKPDATVPIMLTNRK